MYINQYILIYYNEYNKKLQCRGIIFEKPRFYLFHCQFLVCFYFLDIFHDLKLERLWSRGGYINTFNQICRNSEYCKRKPVLCIDLKKCVGYALL